jgi:hypothetical protein
MFQGWVYNIPDNLYDRDKKMYLIKSFFTHSACVIFNDITIYFISSLCSSMAESVHYFLQGDFLHFFTYFIEHELIYRPSASTLSEDARIEPGTVATSPSAVRRSNHSARSHPHSARSHLFILAQGGSEGTEYLLFPKHEAADPPLPGIGV